MNTRLSKDEILKMVKSCSISPEAAFSLVCCDETAGEKCLFDESWEKRSAEKSGSKRKRRNKLLLFADSGEVAIKLKNLIEDLGSSVALVFQGKEYSRAENAEYSVNPRSAADFISLFKALSQDHYIPDTIVNCWAVRNRKNKKSEKISCDALLYSVLALRGTAFRKKVNIISLTQASNNCSFPPCGTSLSRLAEDLSKIYTGINFRTVDVFSGCLTVHCKDTFLDDLVREITGSSEDKFVALRKNGRYVRIFNPVILKKPVKNNVPGISEGSYTMVKKIGEVPNDNVPPQNAKKAFLGEENLLDIADTKDYICETEKILEKRLNISCLADCGGLDVFINKVCISYICKYFHENGINILSGSTCTLEGIKAKLRILPQFEKFLTYMLMQLEKNNITRREGGNIRFIKDFSELEPADALSARAEKQFPMYAGIFEVISHCANNYTKALNGEIFAISVLMPNGQPDYLQEKVNKNVVFGSEKLYCDLLVELIAALMKRQSKKHFRILEVGAGTGVFTKCVLPKIEGFSVEYYFTDIGKSFINKAQTEYQYDFMKFKELDISKDPVEQGFEEDGFDIVVGLDVVHSTPNIEQTLGNIKKLLKKNGLAAVIEGVKEQIWVNMMWGVAQGWWYFEDTDLRRYSPLMGIEKWEFVFEKLKFKNVFAYPLDREKRKTADCSLIVAQK